VRKPIRSLITQFVIVVLLALGALWLWKNSDQLPLIGTYFSADETQGAAKQSRPPTPVDIAIARTGHVEVILEAIGTAFANEAVTITSEVSGVIQDIHFHEGEAVEKGSVLVNLESGVQLAEVEVRIAEVRVREAQLQKVQQLYDRAIQLSATRNIPEARVEELAAELKAAEAVVQSGKANLQVARERLAKRRVVAPFPGRIGIRRVSPGTLIEPNDPIVTLDDISLVKLDFQIPERSLSNIRVGQEINASTAAFPGRVFFGTVSSVDTRVDRVTRAIHVRAVISNEDESLKPGMFLLVELGVDERADAVLIPEQAVVSDGTSSYVYVVVDGEAIRRPIVVGERMPGEVEIMEGVTSGEAVIIGGVQKVRDGAKVKPRQMEQAPSTG
tara:strand:- start:1558 stop:2718 length:1161 start_codon:yes stop_codon:yes gene_type:complete